MDEPFSFGTWLKQRRRTLNLTQANLARRVGCATVTLQKIELDERRPSTVIAQRLADALQVVPEEHAAFIKSARGELAADRLPTLSMPGPTTSPVPLQEPRVWSHHATLPVSLTPLIGREQETATVLRLLQRPDVRLLTLTGAGGSGKTRLAIHIGGEIQAMFADGIWFANLAPVSDTRLVTRTIAAALDIKETGRQPIEESLIAYLRPKHLLLIVDNFEHVAAAAPLVTDLLRAAPRLKVLITSRVTLHISGEYEYPVPPLTVPDLQHLPSTEQMLEYEAVRLFCARAQAVQGSFSITSTNAAAVAEICVRLDGLPLAIELAAARSKLFTPQALLGRLNKRLQLLTSGVQDAAPRQQTLRDTIAWSYNLLEPNQQTLFMRLAVFIGGCTLQAAAAVCYGADAQEIGVLDELASLVDKSLLLREAPVADEPRFRMLETIHEYASEQLAASGEAAALQRKHAIYFVAEAERAAPEWVSRTKAEHDNQPQWVSRTKAEHDNLLAVCRYVAVYGEVELGLRLGLALKPFWYLLGAYAEARQWLDTMLNLPAREPTHEHGVMRVQALQAAADVARWQGNREEQTLRLKQSLDLARELGDIEGSAEALSSLGLVAYVQGSTRQTRVLLEESLKLYQVVGDTYGEATVLGMLGTLVRAQGDEAHGMALMQTSRDLIRAGAISWQSAWALWLVGDFARANGDVRQARELLDEVLERFLVVRDEWAIGCILTLLGILAHQEGDVPRATTLLRKSLIQFEALEHPPGVLGCLMGLVGIARAQGQMERAGRLAGAAATLSTAIGSALPPHMGDLSLADLTAYEHHLMAVRAVLSEEQFAAAWAEGQAMTLEQVIAYALEGELMRHTAA